MENLLKTTLATVADWLEQNGYPYALAGGLAVGLLIEPRATMDIDLCCRLAENEFPAFFERLRKLFPALIPHEQPMRFARLTIWRAVIPFGPRSVILDFLISPLPGLMDEIIARRVPLTVGDRTLYVISPEDLIILKTWSDRPQDRLDAERITAKYAGSLDRDYLQRWLATAP